MDCTGVNALNPVCQIGTLVEGAAGSVATSAFDEVASEFSRVAADAVSWLWGQLTFATDIHLGGQGFTTDLAATGAIAGIITTTLFLIQVIVSALKREPGGLVRAVRGLGISFIGSAFAIASTGILLSLVDALSAGVVSFALNTNLQGLGQKLVAVTSLSTLSPAAALLVSFVLLAAVVIVWAALMIRKLLIIVAAVFAPVAFSGATADMTRSWVRKWIELTVALITSKLILVIIFMIGLSVLDGAAQAGDGVGQDVTQLMVGSLILLLGGLAPWMAVKMVHFAGDSFVTLHGHASVASSGGRQAIAAPQKAVSAGQQVQRYVGGSGGGQSSPTSAAGSAGGSTATGSGAGMTGGTGAGTAGASGAGTGAGVAGAGAVGAGVAGGLAVMNGVRETSARASGSVQQATSSVASDSPSSASSSPSAAGEGQIPTQPSRPQSS